MTRSYSDDTFGVKQMLQLQASGALNGTQAADTELQRVTFMHPATVLDWNVFYEAGGTSSNSAVKIGKSVAGTGAVTDIGTITIGTQATDTVKDGSVTETEFDAGDDLVFERVAGTTTTVENVIPTILYREAFQATTG